MHRKMPPSQVISCFIRYALYDDRLFKFHLNQQNNFYIRSAFARAIASSKISIHCGYIKDNIKIPEILKSQSFSVFFGNLQSCSTRWKEIENSISCEYLYYAVPLILWPKLTWNAPKFLENFECIELLTKLVYRFKLVYIILSDFFNECFNS